MLDRKYLATVPPLIAFVGAIVSARATSMNMLIVGGILIGTTLSTRAIVQAIPSEILPLKYRTRANGLSFMGGCRRSVSGCSCFLHISFFMSGFPNSLISIGGLGAGAVTNVNEEGWRYLFWIQAALHGSTSLGLLLFYRPPRNIKYPELRLQDHVWACDPIGSTLFICGATLILLALDWVAGSYLWSNPHVAVPLSLGLAILIVFSGYGEAHSLIPTE